MMTRATTEALATLTAHLRPDWDRPGILAAIGKAQALGTPVQVSRALVNLAENRDLRTPAILPTPGNHWRAPDGQHPELRGSHDVKCPEHPLSVHPCPQCAAKRCDPTPDYLAAKEALPKLTPPAVVKPPTLTDAESAALARKRIEEEKR